MNPKTGRTSGSFLVFRTNGVDQMVDVCKHCPHAARMRLRRVPKRLRAQPYKCSYCGNIATLQLPCDCPACGRTLRGAVADMTAAEMFLSARLNGLRPVMRWEKSTMASVCPGPIRP